MSSGKGTGGCTGVARGRRWKPWARAASNAATASRRSAFSADAGTNQGWDRGKAMSWSSKNRVAKAAQLLAQRGLGLGGIGGGLMGLGDVGVAGKAVFVG